MELKLKDVETKWATEFEILKAAEQESISSLELERDILLKELESVSHI